MARAPAGVADRLSALIAEIEAEAYARGRAGGGARGTGDRPGRGLERCPG